jgi:predicted ATPase
MSEDDLVGRALELAAIDRVLDAVDAGGPGFLAVVGEPGIGQTSVMERLSSLAAGRGWLVLAGARGRQRLAELAAIFPSLDGPAVPDGALQTERYRAHRAVQELLDGLAVGRPLLLSLDDLHWADQASL